MKINVAWRKTPQQKAAETRRKNKKIKDAQELKDREKFGPKDPDPKDNSREAKVHRIDRKKKVWHPGDAMPGYQNKDYKCMVLDHPELDIDIMDAKFKPSGVIPKEGALIYKDEITPILLYSEEAPSTLVPAKGELTLKIPKARWKFLPRKIAFELPSNWWYLTAEYVYANGHSEAPQEKSYTSAVDFVNAIANGELYDTLSNMGPAQFGQDLSMVELDRQLRKQKIASLVDTLSSTFKTLLWSLLAALTLFGIILITGD